MQQEQSNQENEVKKNCECEQPENCCEKTQGEDLSLQEAYEITKMVQEVLESTQCGFIEYLCNIKYKDKDDSFKASVRSAISAGIVSSCVVDICKAPTEISNQLKLSLDRIYFARIQEKENSKKEAIESADKMTQELEDFIKECSNNKVEAKDMPRLLKERFPNFNVIVGRKDDKEVKDHGDLTGLKD